MVLDGPRESESMSMDIDDGAVSCHHPCHCDSAKMNSPGPSGGRMRPDFHPQKHQTVDSVQMSTHSAPSHPSFDCEHLSGSDGSPQFMIPPSPPSPMNPLGEMGDINQNHGLVRQRGDIPLGLEASVREVTPRKRKRTDGSPHTHIDNDNAFTDGANSQSSRRVRPRLRTQQDREFSPLLYIPPNRERDPPVEEETITASHYPTNVTDPSCSIQRCVYLGGPREQDPRTPQSSSSPKVNHPESCKERKRSDFANSFTEVALASTVVTPTHGRLSTLQDFWLPRPFDEDTERSFVDIIKVHERGLEAGPSFLSTNGGRTRTGGLSASREPAGSPTDTLERPIGEYGIYACASPSAILPLEPSSTNFFDKPVCDSPDPIDPTE